MRAGLGFRVWGGRSLGNLSTSNPGIRTIWDYYL